MWITNRKKGDDEILSKKKIFRHFSNICCPLTFCREWKRSSVNTLTLIQPSLDQEGDRHTRSQTEQNARFGFMNIKLKLLHLCSVLCKFHQVNIPHTMCILIQFFTLQSYPWCPACHNTKKIKKYTYNENNN